MKIIQVILKVDYLFCLTGGADRRGGRIITFPAESFLIDILDEEHIGKVLWYLANIPRFVDIISTSFKNLIRSLQ